MNSNPTTRDHVPNSAMAARRDDAEVDCAGNMKGKTSVVDSNLALNPVHLWNFKAWPHRMDRHLGTTHGRSTMFHSDGCVTQLRPSRIEWQSLASSWLGRLARLNPMRSRNASATSLQQGLNSTILTLRTHRHRENQKNVRWMGGH